MFVLGVSDAAQMCQVFAPLEVWPLFEGMAYPFGQGWTLGRWAEHTGIDLPAAKAQH